MLGDFHIRLKRRILFYEVLTLGLVCIDLLHSLQIRLPVHTLFPVSWLYLDAISRYCLLRYERGLDVARGKGFAVFYLTQCTVSAQAAERCRADNAPLVHRSESTAEH